MPTSKLFFYVKAGCRFHFLVILTSISLILPQLSTPLPFERSSINLRYLHSLGQLDQADISQLPLVNRDQLFIISELPNFLTPFHKIHTDQNNIARIGAYPIIEYRDELLLHLRSIVEISLGKNFYLKNTMLLDKSLADQQGYIGKEWRGFVGYAEEAYLQFHKKNKIEYTFQAGRFYSYWGPGRTGQLLQSYAARPLDQIQASIKYLNWSFAWKASQLDAIGDNNRYLSAHRVTYKSKWFRLSLNEAVLYGGDSKNIELAYLNPFIVYTGEQINGPALKANTMLSIDGRLFLNNKSIYFEFLIDDFQADADVIDDLEPNELGLILGADFSLEKVYLGIEFVGITNRTYKTNVDHEWYIHRNNPIGYGEGSDLWRANVFGRYYYSQDWQFDCEIDYLVKGEGEMSQPWDTPWNDDGITMETGYDEAFPTGILEKQFFTNIGIFRMFDYNKWISVEIKYISSENINHMSGIDEDDFEVSFGLSWVFTKEFNLE